MGTYIEIDGHSVDALKYIEELEAENRRLGDFANAKVQEIKALRAENEFLARENEDLAHENLALKGSNASLVGTLEDVTANQREHVAQLKEFKAQLEALGAETRHIIELREDGFTIMHPLACRPNLFDCSFNAAARAEEDILIHVGPGRYYCSLAGVDNLLIDEPVPDA